MLPFFVGRLLHYNMEEIQKSEYVPSVELQFIMCELFPEMIFSKRMALVRQIMPRVQKSLEHWNSRHSDYYTI